MSVLQDSMPRAKAFGNSFFSKGMYYSHKWKTVTFLCISELALLLNYMNTAVILIGMKQNAIHV